MNLKTKRKTCKNFHDSLKIQSSVVVSVTSFESCIPGFSICRDARKNSGSVVGEKCPLDSEKMKIDQRLGTVLHQGYKVKIVKKW